MAETYWQRKLLEQYCEEEIEIFPGLRRKKFEDLEKRDPYLYVHAEVEQKGTSGFKIY